MRVKSIDGREEVYSIDLSQFVSELKAKITERSGWPKEMVRLVLPPRLLADNLSLAEYGMRKSFDGSSIQLHHIPILRD